MKYSVKEFGCSVCAKYVVFAWILACRVPCDIEAEASQRFIGKYTCGILNRHPYQDCGETWIIEEMHSLSFYFQRLLSLLQPTCEIGGRYPAVNTLFVNNTV